MCGKVPKCSNVLLTDTVQYAMSDSIMHPASAPDYYTTLVSEIEESPRRSWLRNMINKFTGMVRMK